MATQTTGKLSDDQEGKKARVRSPGYPAITLEEAIKRAREFYNYEKRNSANVEVAMKHWGLKPTSGGALVAMAALHSFGLLSGTGTGKQRKVQLTELALKIILDERPQSSEREEAIKQAALMPKIHASLWNKYRTSLPSDENLRYVLVSERKFNENSVNNFISEYRATIRFAKLEDFDSVSGIGEDIPEGNEMPGSEQRNGVVTQPVSLPKGTATDWMAPSDSGMPQRAKVAPPSPKEISLPVGVSEDGQVIFAHVRFDAPLKKGMLTSLQQLLNALEKNLA